MIVFYNQPNTLTLPYVYTVKEKGESKTIKDNFRFIPGINKITKDAWLAITKTAGDDMDYYRTILKVFQPKIDPLTKEEIGEEEDKIDVKKLNVQDMLELIENTMSLEKLELYYEYEKDKNKPRAPITRLLKSKINEVSQVEEAIRKSKEKK